MRRKARWSKPRLLKMAKILGTLAESLYMDFYSTFPKDGEPANAAST